MKAIIFCGGEIEDYTYLKDMDFDEPLVICADGGLKHTKALGVVPDIIIGDGDSWQGEYPSGPEIIKYPTDKDFTDTDLCVDCAIDKGCTEIELLGGIGGRLDHEFSHYCIMRRGLSNGVRIKMINEQNEIWMEDKPFIIKRDEKKYISFFPYGGSVEGFTVRGLKYKAAYMTLSCERVQASSNEFVDGDTAEIFFKSGTLLVMRCKDKNL